MFVDELIKLFNSYLFFSIYRQSINLFMWIDLVSKFTERTEESWRWNDPKKASNVYNGIRASGIFCAKYAIGAHELHW